MRSSIPIFVAALPFASATYPPSRGEPWDQLPGSVYTPPQAWASCKDVDWPVSDVGEHLMPQAPDAELEEMLAEVDPARIQNTIATLVSFGTRHTLSIQNSSARGIGAARDWLLSEMQSYASTSGGAMEAYLNSYIQPPDGDRVYFPVNISNIVGQINGTDDPNRVYVVTGHYDSRRLNISDYTGDAPGADDDASGVALVMELARICAKRRPKATMIFAAVAGEEQNLYGSAHLAKTLKRAGYNVEAHFNDDTVGTGKNAPYHPINDHTIRLFGASIFYPNVSTSVEQEEVGLIGCWNDSPAQNLGRAIAEIAAGAIDSVGMQVKLIYRADRFLRGGDHLSFLEQGFPAVRLTEAVEDFAHQHQDVRLQDGHQYGDLIQYVDFEYIARVARTNLAAMWSFANAPGLPKNVTISEVVGFTAADRSTPWKDVSNDSKFCWNTGNDPLVEGYELVWRASGNLQWTDVLRVGDVGHVRVELLKDNLQFGVRAVGRDGKKSAAVAPEPSEYC
jgi:hypothetical protein